MDEVLKSLMESEILSEDNKKQITEGLATYLAEKEQEMRAELEATVTATLTEQFIADKEALVEAVDTKLDEVMKKELEELRESIEQFRDLEAEFAAKEVALKEEMAKKLEESLENLVDVVDDFLEHRLAQEFTELRESIEEVKKVEFGRKLFEAYANVFNENFNDEEGLRNQIVESKNKNLDLQKKLEESSQLLESLKREKAMGKALENLHGRPREVMEAILRSVKTEKINETYERYIERVLHESAKAGSEKEIKPENNGESVLAESVAAVDKTKVVNGDNQTALNEGAAGDKTSVDAELKNRLRKLAGLG